MAKTKRGHSLESPDMVERIERLIAATEHAANAMNRLAQALEQKRSRRSGRPAKVRRTPARKVEISPRSAAAAKAAVARILGGQ